MNSAGLPLTDQAIAEMTDEQRAILHELGQYAAQELNLSKLIRDTSDEVKHAMTEAGFTRSEKPGVLHEDPEVDVLISDPSKARQMLGWDPKVRFQDLVEMMVEADLQKLKDTM